MPDNTIEIDPRIGTHDVNGWRAVPHPTNPTGRRNGAWCVVAGDYADEGEPDVLIEVTAAEHPKDIAEFVVQAVINEYARRTSSEPCPRCEGSRIEPGSAEYAEHSNLPINGQRCSACDGTGARTPGDAETGQRHEPASPVYCRAEHPFGEHNEDTHICQGFPAHPDFGLGHACRCGFKWAARIPGDAETEDTDG